MGKRVHAPKEQKIKEMRRVKVDRYYRTCPKCTSIKVTTSKSSQEGLPPEFKCRACSYKSYFFPEMTKEQLKHRKKMSAAGKKRKRKK